MEAEFFTTNSILTVKNNTIRQKRVIESPKTYWFHSFVLMLFLIGYTVYEIPEKPHRWIYIIMLLIWISPHFMTIFQILFINSWKSNIKLSDIRDIKIEKQENELEEKVILILRSGRQKKYMFRKMENQAEKFVAVLSSQSSFNSIIA